MAERLTRPRRPPPAAGAPSDLVNTQSPAQRLAASEAAAAPLAGWRELEQLKLLNLLYDVTPADFVTAVACEAGIVPTTSVPVVLREYADGAGMGTHTRTLTDVCVRACVRAETPSGSPRPAERPPSPPEWTKPRHVWAAVQMGVGFRRTTSCGAGACRLCWGSG
jgi:hypothetical protein